VVKIISVNGDYYIINYIVIPKGESGMNKVETYNVIECIMKSDLFEIQYQMELIKHLIQDCKVVK